MQWSGANISFADLVGLFVTNKHVATAALHGGVCIACLLIVSYLGDEAGYNEGQMSIGFGMV